MSGGLVVWLSGGSVGWLAGWLLDWLGGCLVRWLANQLTDHPTNRPNWLRKLSNWRPKSFQNLSQEASWRGLGGSLGGVLGALGGVLGPSWPQDGSKSPKKLENQFLGPPLGGHLGAQNRSKWLPRAIRNVIIFMIDLKIGFWSDLVPTWLPLDPQNPPKMGSSWRQHRSKLER